MNKRSDTALRILQLLLSCGMICQEELDIVLELMAPAQGNRTAEPPTNEVSVSESRESTLVFKFD